MEFEERRVDFWEAERRYAELKRKHAAGAISDEELDAQLKQLMVLDDQGRWWVKSRGKGEWHYYDGAGWVREAPPKDAEERQQETERRKPVIDDLTRICAKYAGKSYYVGEAIPKTQLADARLHFPIPASEQVLALIDTTDFLSKGFGLAVCQEGIRWRTSSNKRNFLGWQEFSAVPIEERRLRQLMWKEYVIEMGEGRRFYGRNSVMPKDEAIRLLREIQSLVKVSPTSGSV